MWDSNRLSILLLIARYFLFFLCARTGGWNLLAARFLFLSWPPVIKETQRLMTDSVFLFSFLCPNLSSSLLVSVDHVNRLWFLLGGRLTFLSSLHAPANHKRLTGGQKGKRPPIGNLCLNRSPAVSSCAAIKREKKNKAAHDMTAVRSGWRHELWLSWRGV